MAFSFFFRDYQTLDRTVRHLVPTLIGRSRIRVWDAGCALGQEAYTLAIMFAENMGHFAFKNLRIDATDLDPEGNFGPTVTEGVYPEGFLSRLPEHIFATYFEPAGPGEYRVVEEVRSRVKFRRHDLTTLKPMGEGYSLVVCKNVLLHLEYEMRVKVIEMFHWCLAPGGCFVTEQTQKMPPEAGHLFDKLVPDAELWRKQEAPVVPAVPEASRLVAIENFA